MRGAKRLRLTTRDLVLLSLLAERPWHGYQANLELERRQVRDWAAISRPQIYYSLEKLGQAGLLEEAAETAPAAGPERRVWRTTRKGKTALADALERKDWATQRERPPLLTWMALSWQARPGVFETQLGRRRKYLREELRREQQTLAAVLKEVGHRCHEAVWAVTLMIDEFRAELKWLEKVSRQARRRAPARHPMDVPESAGRN